MKLHFDGHLRLEFRGARVTTDAGLLAVRELDDMLRLTADAGDMLHDSRTGRNTRHELSGLLRQSVYARLAGYEDVNDQENLTRDPAMRAVVGKKAIERNAASQNTVSRFETETLATEDNIAALSSINGLWVSHAMKRTKTKKVILDMDSSESPVHGNQEGSAYNGHFGSTCYHPLFIFNQAGDCEAACLRPGNVHSANGWRELLEPVIRRYADSGRKLYFRGDAAFASPDIYEYLEEQGILYAIRISGNQNLYAEVEHLMSRPVGRPPKKPRIFYHSFSYRAASWTRSRRVVAKIEWHEGELHPRVGFIVTNLQRKPSNVTRFYNQVRLALFVLAYNLGNFIRRFALPKMVSHWSLRSVQLKLIKIGARVVSHSRRTIFQCAEVAVPEALFADLLDRIHALAAEPT
jgi:hypothetical protein